jgi:hypothetical protein
MRNTMQRLLASMLALTVAFAAVTGGGAAAVPTLDTENTDTTATSPVQPGTVVQDFDASSSNASTVLLQASTGENDTRVSFVHNASANAVIAENASGAFVEADATNGESYHNHTIWHDSLADLERGINDNVTVSIRATNDTTATSPDTGYLGEFYIETDDSATVEYVGADDIGGLAELDNETATEVLGMEVPFTGNDQSDIETDDRAINDSTEIVIALGDAGVSEDFESVADDVSAEAKLSSFLTFGPRNVVLLEGDDTTQAVPVFYQEAPDSVDDGDTYAVMDSVGGTQALTINPGSAFDDADEVSAHAVGGAGLTTFFVDYAMAGLPLSLGGGVVGVLTAGGLPLAAIRTEPRDRFRTSDADEAEA